MIVLIDGACGVGKSTVALGMQRILKDGTAVLDSDREFCNFANDVIEKDGDVCQVVSGVRGSVEFQRNFCEKLLHIEKTGVIVIVPMALDSNLCKVFFDKVLSERSHNYTHFLLTASRETIINRINNDNTNNCFLQALFGKSCKVKLAIRALPKWHFLQGWYPAPADAG